MQIKLEHYGIKGVAPDLLKSYPSNRQQYVSLNNVVSDLRSISIGVPQGSVLGPLLFLIYINDIDYSIDNPPRLFADDTALLASASSLNELKNKLNADLNSVSHWMKLNRLTLNSSKTNTVVFPPTVTEKFSPIQIMLNSDIVTNSECIEYLGIKLDYKLTFREQISTIRNKLTRGLAVMSKLNRFLPKSTLKQLYYAIFHPHLLYGINIWGATYISYLKPIRILQNKALRLLSNAHYRSSANPLYFRNKVLKFDDLLFLETAKLMYKIDRCQNPTTLNHYFKKTKNVHSFNTCSTVHQQYYPPKFKTNRLQRSLAYRGVKIWNKLPPEIKSTTSFGGFTKNLKKYLIQKYI